MPKYKKDRVRYDDSPYKRASDAKKKRIKEIIESLLNPTHPKWKGEGVPLTPGRSVFGTNTELRDEVNRVGVIHGCHECLTVLSKDTDQPWIGDHIPPTNLKASARVHYDVPDDTRLLPSCGSRSTYQAGLIQRLNGTALQNLPKLTGRDKKLILGGKTSQAWLPSFTSKVSATQGLEIQRNGTIDGCHACGTKIPCDRYIADHCPPQQFLTSWMPQLCRKLDVDIPEAEARPHCPRCSSGQGGSMSRFIQDAKKLAKDLGITVYS